MPDFFGLSQSPFTITDEAGDFLEAVRHHKRFRLRAVAIVAASLSSILNFFILFLCIFGSDQLVPPRILTGCAYIPLVLSLAWDSLDLIARRVFRQDVAPSFIVLMDSLGFLGFLAILITNGVIASNLQLWSGSGIIVMLSYNSVPWMICW